jgi:predicted XRE-type DNA-binding protein
VRRRIRVEEGSGNVFADIGMPNPEEALAKAEIARQMNRILAQRGLNQVQAGELLRIAQPRVSDLARGRLGKLSLEKLLQFARLTGIDVEIRMKASSKPGLTVKSRAG